MDKNYIAKNIEEADNWFSEHSSGNLICEKDGAQIEANCFPVASKFFGEKSCLYCTHYSVCEINSAISKLQLKTRFTLSSRLERSLASICKFYVFDKEENR